MAYIYCFWYDDNIFPGNKPVKGYLGGGNNTLRILFKYIYPGALAVNSSGVQALKGVFIRLFGSVAKRYVSAAWNELRTKGPETT